jgi:hypothetical protein
MTLHAWCDTRCAYEERRGVDERVLQGLRTARRLVGALLRGLHTAHGDAWAAA